MKLDFLSIFDIPLSKCFIFKRVSSLPWAPPPQKKISVFSLVVLFDDQSTFVNWILNWISSLIKAAVTLWNILSFLHFKIKQTLHCLLLGFPKSSLLFSVKKEWLFDRISLSTSQEVRRNRSQGFCSCKNHYFLFLNNLDTLLVGRLIYTFIYVTVIEMRQGRLRIFLF